MAGSKSDYLEGKVLDHHHKTTAYTVWTNIYIALFTVAPSDTGGGTEVSTSATAYARVAHNVWDAASGGATENTGAITFAQATADWGTVVAFAQHDAASGAGNYGYWGDLTASKAVNNGDTAEFADGAIDIVET